MLNVGSLWRSGKRTGLRIQGSWVRPPPGTLNRNFSRFLSILYCLRIWGTRFDLVIVIPATPFDDARRRGTTIISNLKLDRLLVIIIGNAHIIVIGLIVSLTYYYYYRAVCTENVKSLKPKNDCYNNIL